ncbi:MAG: threonine--tRNA ligase [Candidatus Paceibacterota bacterium]|jgi:threonyl-tRNA synthetase
MASIEEKRHTLAHLLAQAVLETYPNAQLALGPAIENGFYYDIDFGTEKISEADLPKIENTMRKNLPRWDKFTHIEVPRDEAYEYFSSVTGVDQYKGELIKEISERGEPITLYTCGGFTDLCIGGHTENPARDIASDSFTLDRIAGAYWRGDEKNQMLTRIYGLAFDTKEELDAYKAQREEAEKRDHKKLGREMKLFTISALVGAGLPLLQPKGAVIRREIEEYLWELHKNKGYDRVWTPHLAKEALYETSGHAAKFGDELFRVSGSDEKFFLKPMNCPHHMQIFADNQFSYRDMPVRYFEPATVYRDEKTGQLAGLTRVRSITQDDGHLFCRVSQIGEEVSTIVGIIHSFYKTMKMLDGYWVRLSVRGEGGKYLGEDEVWEKAESALEEAARQNNLPYKRVEGEAAFYGPKLDFIFKDAIGREWQLATIQCDFNLPERFDLSYINEKGEKERPVVIHRAISGSLERFMGVAIEHFAGAFPLWLAPVQAKVLSVSEKHASYAQEVASELKAAGIRAEADDSNESLGKKIREAKLEKIPYLLVVGDAEVAAQTVSVESRDAGKLDTMSVPSFISRASEEIKMRR